MSGASQHAAPNGEPRPGGSDAKRLERAVETFATAGDVVVATDFDGVLAPLVLDPSASAPLPGTIESLRAMARLEGVHVAVVSGRDLATLRRLTGLGANDGVVLIGSHGAETSEPLSDGEARASSALSDAERVALESATRALEAVVARFPQARIEHKPAGVVLHTRGMPDAEADAATKAALAVPDEVAGVRAMRGKSVVELPVLDVSKGSALTAFAAARGAQALAYLGDDVTDESVFELFAPQRGHVTVKVGDGESAAGYRVADAQDVPGLLARFVAALSNR